MIQSGLQFELTAANPDAMRLTFISSVAYKPEAWTLVADQLGSLNAGLIRVTRSATAFGGFQYLYGEPTTLQTPRSDFGYRVYAFSNMHDFLKLTAGRWPERLPAPDSPERNANSEEESIAKGLGMYSRGDVEGVITSAVARRTRYEIGTRVAVGETPANRVVINIVGIVEVVDPNDPIWQTNSEALTGELLGTPLSGQTFNASIFVTEGAYSDWLIKATRTGNTDNNSYIWQIKLNTQVMNADNLDNVQQRLTYIGNQMAASYSGLITFDPLLKLINNYKGRLANIQGPVLLLSSTALILMLYHLVATAGLALERQASEWASMASRGASTGQLITLQA